MLRPVARRLVIDPFQQFFQQETSGGLLLFLAALLALLWANSPWKGVYFQLQHTPLSIGLTGNPDGLPYLGLSLSLRHWINDGLMTVFFLLVGLEIKRELQVGELSSIRLAAFPLMAALGGMLAPGLLYILFNPPGSAFHVGWGIPTVTDIAFSLGVLALLGSRVPLFLKVFLTALAIMDDLGAILLIGFFYSNRIQWLYLLLAVVPICFLGLLNRLQIRWLPAYIFFGLVLWRIMLYSGVHATLAGVLLAVTIPATAKIRVREESLATLAHEKRCEEVHTPLQRLEHWLHPWVTYGVMPLFALANAGVPLSLSGIGASLTHPVALALIAGLTLGKPFGIALFSYLSVRLGLTELPSSIRWIHMTGLACLGGIGFTMSLFIADLAFEGAVLNVAKIGIFTASLFSGLLGWLLLRKSLKTVLSL